MFAAVKRQDSNALAIANIAEEAGIGDISAIVWQITND